VLPYTAEVLANLTGQLNAAHWPLHLLLWLLTCLALAQALRPAAGANRLPALLLAAGWGWVAWVWFWRTLAPLDFMAPVYAGLFALQALLLLGYALGGRATLNFGRAPGRWLGLALLLLGAVALPLVDMLAGHAPLESGLLWMAPTPSAVATLGLLLLIPRPPLGLAVLPLLWGLAAGAIGWVLGMPAALLGAAAAVLGAAAILALRLRRPEGAPSG
jgi:hypothetical protein